MEHLLTVLLTNEFQDKNKGSKRKSCLALILKIINSLLIEPNTSSFNHTLLNSSVDIEKLIEKLLEIVWFASIPASELSDTIIKPFIFPGATIPPTTDDVQVVNHALNLLSNVLSFFPNKVDLIQKHTQFSQWLWGTILCSSEKAIRENIVETFFHLSTTLEKSR